MLDQDVLSNHNSLSAILKESMDECYPYKVTQLKQKQYNNPWITEELKHLIKQKNKLYPKYLDKPITHGDEFRRLRNRISHLIRTCKRNYYTNQFEDVSGDSKGTWRVLSKLINKNK